ncbi:hypothetical protein B0H14DRAFT_2614581 [Mycena olivaceomarginata]|nr:hypothetical protein B0H14DRAFT_2614581 [Mycena olivaceomarginata]
MKSLCIDPYFSRSLAGNTVRGQRNETLPISRKTKKDVTLLLPSRFKFRFYDKSLATGRCLECERFKSIAPTERMQDVPPRSHKMDSSLPCACVWPVSRTRLRLHVPMNHSAMSRQSAAPSLPPRTSTVTLSGRESSSSSPVPHCQASVRLGQQSYSEQGPGVLVDKHKVCGPGRNRATKLIDIDDERGRFVLADRKDVELLPAGVQWTKSYIISLHPAPEGCTANVLAGQSDLMPCTRISPSRRTTSAQSYVNRKMGLRVGKQANYLNLRL